MDVQVCAVEPALHIFRRGMETAVDWRRLDVDRSQEGREREWWEEGRRAEVEAFQSRWNGRPCCAVQGKTPSLLAVAGTAGH